MFFRLAENTLLIFTSDNGGVEYTEPPATDNQPFKGGKACLYEGGVRVPTIEPPPIPNSSAHLAPWTKSNFLAAGDFKIEAHLQPSSKQVSHGGTETQRKPN